MKQKNFIFLASLLLVIVSVWTFYFRNDKNQPAPKISGNKMEIIANSELSVPAAEKKIKENSSDFLPPLSRAGDRITKKPFGIFIAPQTSPVQPERFRGYHTGTDFEIFPDEENIDVPVMAVCNGKLLMKKSATGYGGVIVESCTLNGEPIAVVYGHLKLESIKQKVGEKINAGETLGILGRGYSAETGGERKHLHLGFHRGTAINISGYTQDVLSLSGWIDPCLYTCGN